MAAIELRSTPLFYDSNLLAYYRLENTADSKGSYTLTNNNTVTFGSAKFANGSIHSSNKYFSASAILSSKSNWSVSLWAKAGSTNQFGRIFGIGNTGSSGFWISQSDSSTHITAGARLNVMWGGINYYDTEWDFPDTTNFYHIVITRDTTTARCYINGSVLGVTNTQAPSDPTTGTFIGANQAGSENWAGTIDDIAVFNKVLTAKEISQLYYGSWPRGSFLLNFI